jgi:hypothetical protein
MRWHYLMRSRLGSDPLPRADPRFEPFVLGGGLPLSGAVRMFAQRLPRQSTGIKPWVGAAYGRRMAKPSDGDSRNRVSKVARKLRFWRRDDPGGMAGVREPRRPKRISGAGAAMRTRES